VGECFFWYQTKGCKMFIVVVVVVLISDDNTDSAGDEVVITSETADQSSGKCVV